MKNTNKKNLNKYATIIFICGFLICSITKNTQAKPQDQATPTPTQEEQEEQEEENMIRPSFLLNTTNRILLCIYSLINCCSCGRLEEEYDAMLSGYDEEEEEEIVTEIQ